LKVQYFHFKKGKPKAVFWGLKRVVVRNGVLGRTEKIAHKVYHIVWEGRTFNI